MSEKIDCIIKSGIVESIEDKYIKVRIHNQSACSMCYSKGVCTSLGSGERIVDVENDSNHIIQTGDRVDIQMISRSGFLAVLYGYIVPFIILLLTLILVSNYLNESLSALISLLILVPYYLTLYFFRDKLRKYFRFTLS